MKRKPITAGELRACLDKDPAHQQWLKMKEKENEQRLAEMKLDSQELIEALAAKGIHVERLDEVLQPRFVPLSADVVELLLRFLPNLKDWLNQEWAVRLIGATRTPYDARPLAALFDCCDSHPVKWCIGNTLSLTRPTGVDDWMVATLLDKAHGTARHMFCVAIARVVPERANDVLLQVFEDLPGHSALGLAICGGEHELMFLRSKLSGGQAWKTWVRKEIERAIRFIERRLARQAAAESAKQRKARTSSS